MPTINSCFNITNQHNCVGADDFRPRILHKFIYIHFVGTSLAAVRYNLPSLPSRPTTIKLLYFPHFSIFFLFKKVNACKSKRLQKKSKLRAAPRDPTTPRRSIKFAASSAHSPVNSLPLKQYGLVRLASQAVPSPLKRAFKHCGAAIGSLIIKISRVANFYFAKVCSNKTYKL